MTPYILVDVYLDVSKNLLTPAGYESDRQEFGCSMFHRNVGKYPLYYTVS
jgi:hypothetical protein